MRKGYCYRLFSEDLWSRLHAHDDAHIHHTPLDQVSPPAAPFEAAASQSLIVNHCKLSPLAGSLSLASTTPLSSLSLSLSLSLYLSQVALQLRASLNVSVEQLLYELPEPPTPAAIERAFQMLYDQRLIDGAFDTANLTVAGKLAATLPCDLRCSRLITLAGAFGCLPEAIAIAAAMSQTHQPFRQSHVLTDAKSGNGFTAHQQATAQVYLARRRLDGGDYCEPLMLARLLFEWQSLGDDEKAQRRWCSRNGVVRARVRQLAATADLLSARVAKFCRIPAQLLSMRWESPTSDATKEPEQEGGKTEGGRGDKSGGFGAGVAKAAKGQLSEDKVTLLRVLLLWCYWDQVAISSPQGRAKTVEARRVGVLGAPITAGQLEAAAFWNPTGLGVGLSMDPDEPPIPLSWRLIGTTAKTYVASGVDGRDPFIATRLYMLALQVLPAAAVWLTEVTASGKQCRLWIKQAASDGGGGSGAVKTITPAEDLPAPFWSGGVSRASTTQLSQLVNVLPVTVRLSLGPGWASLTCTGLSGIHEAHLTRLFGPGARWVLDRDSNDSGADGGGKGGKGGRNRDKSGTQLIEFEPDSFDPSSVGHAEVQVGDAAKGGLISPRPLALQLLATVAATSRDRCHIRLFENPNKTGDADPARDVKVSVTGPGWKLHESLCGNGIKGRAMLGQNTLAQVAVHCGSEPIYAVGASLMLMGDRNGGGARLEHVTLLPPGHVWTALALAASGMHVSNADRLEQVLEGLGGEGGRKSGGKRTRGGRGGRDGEDASDDGEGPGLLSDPPVSIARQIQIAKDKSLIMAQKLAQSSRGASGRGGSNLNGRNMGDTWVSEAQELRSGAFVAPPSIPPIIDGKINDVDGADEDWGGAGDIAPPPTASEMARRQVEEEAAAVTAKAATGVLGVIGWEVRADAAAVGAELMRLMDTGE